MSMRYRYFSRFFLLDRHKYKVAYYFTDVMLHYDNIKSILIYQFLSFLHHIVSL